jgi:hypothetical protein
LNYNHLTKMGYAILACLVEENYRHNIRRAINNLKKNVSEIKSNTMIKIKTLLQNNKKLMIKKMLQEIKTHLNSIKVSIPRYSSAYYLSMELDTDYYLYYVLQNTDGINGDGDWGDVSWVYMKKTLLDKITVELNNATIEALLRCFEDGLNEFGKFKYDGDNIFRVRMTLYNSWDSDIVTTKLQNFINL